MKRKLGVGLAGTILAILLSVVLGSYWIALEGVFLDWRLKLKKPIQLSKKIKVFEVNEQNQSTCKAIIEELFKQGAKTISIYTSEDELRKNLEWIQEIPKSKTVMSAGGQTIKRLLYSDDSYSLGMKTGFIKVSSLVDFLSMGAKKTLVESPTFEQMYFTHSNVHVDHFGKYRKIPLWVESEKRLIPSFALNSWFHYLDIENPKIKLLSSRVEIKDELVELAVPTDLNGMAMIEAPEDFELSIIQLGNNKRPVVETVSEADVKNKLASVGFFASDNELNEKSLFRVQVGLLNSLLEKSFLKEAHKSTVHSLSLILSILAIIFCRKNKGMVNGLSLAILISSYLVINIMFFRMGLILPVLSPVFAMVFSVLADRMFSSNKMI